MDRLDPRRCATPQVVAKNKNESGPKPANQNPWQERSGPAGWGVRKEGAGLRERVARRGRLLGGAADQTSSRGRRALPCREDLSGGPSPCGAWQERSGPGMEGVQALAAKRQRTTPCRDGSWERRPTGKAPMGVWGACRSFPGWERPVRSRGVAGAPAEWGAPHAVGAGGKTFPPPNNSIVAPVEG